MRPALILFFLVLTACGSGGSGGGSAAAPGACFNLPFKGTWRENAGTAVWKFAATCRGAEAVDCGLIYTHNLVTDSLQSFDLVVTQSNNAAGCLPVGSQSCTWSMIDPSNMFINCGLGNKQYSKTSDSEI